jgi:benzoyl-CoA reductase/2-hydroxyglutaryl-CoA dehydratase subunit BcrC/BadD/HgdB
MEPSKTDKIRQTVTRRLAMEVQQTLKSIRESVSEPLDSMEYFYTRYQEHYLNPTAAQEQKLRIGTMCLQVPEELIYAVGAEPVRLCSGSYTHDQVGSDYLPAKSCALVKSTFGGLRLTSEESKPDLIIIPTTCDQKRKTGMLLEEMDHEVYMLEVPARKDTENGRFYWQNAVKEMVGVLQKKTGRKITRKSLKEALHKTQQAREAFRRFSGYRKHKPSLISGREAFLISNAYLIDSPDRWAEALDTTSRELQNRLESGKFIEKSAAPRLLLTGSPPIFPNLKLPMMVEDAGAVIVADEVCSSNRMLHDAPMYEEASLYDMIPAISDRYLKPCTCPCFVPNDDRKRRIAELAGSYDVEGVVYQAFSGCHLYEMEQKSIQTHLASMGIPMLYIETDYSPEDAGQISTRVEAFVESIKLKSRRN